MKGNDEMQRIEERKTDGNNKELNKLMIDGSREKIKQ